MLESSFIAPVLTNDGADTYTAQLVAESALLGAFGGYTRESGITGAWLSPSGAVMTDESVRYVIAADWTDERRAKLRAIVAAFAWRASQEAVYLRTDSGAVELVAPQEPADLQRAA